MPASRLRFPFLWALLATAMLGCQSSKVQSSRAPTQALPRNAPLKIATRKAKAKPQTSPKLTVNYRRVTLQEVAKDIEKRCAVRVIIEPGLARTVSLNLVDVHWTQVLKILARFYKFKLETRPSQAILKSPSTVQRISFNNTDLKTALLVLAQASEQNIIIGPQVQGRVTATLHNVDPKSALKSIAKAHNTAVIGDND